MKKILSLIAVIAMLCAFSTTALAAETVVSNTTIAKGQTVTKDGIDIMNFATSLTYTNNGTLNVTNYFSLYKSAFVNNGTFTFNGATFGTDSEGGSSFVNNGTATISTTSAFIVDAGNSLTNSGVLNLSSIQNYTLTGSITNTGYIVYDKSSVNIHLIEALKSIGGNVMTQEEYAAALKGNTITAVPGTDSHDVMAKSTGSVATPVVYSVDVSWGAMEFTYNVGGTKDWNADDHSYTDNSTASWTASGNTVTVTNHSNKAVTAAFVFVKDSAITESITGTFDIASEQLDAGTVGGYDSADKVVSTLTVGGVLDSTRTALTKVGTVTVTIQ